MDVVEGTPVSGNHQCYYHTWGLRIIASHFFTFHNDRGMDFGPLLVGNNTSEFEILQMPSFEP